MFAHILTFCLALFAYQGPQPKDLTGTWVLDNITMGHKVVFTRSNEHVTYIHMLDESEGMFGRLTRTDSLMTGLQAQRQFAQWRDSETYTFTEDSIFISKIYYYD